MAARTFRENGVQWTVWDVLPTLPTPVPLDARLSNGWLTFKSATEKRRLVPIPEGWTEWSDEQLIRLLRTAQVVPLNQSGLDVGWSR